MPREIALRDITDDLLSSRSLSPDPRLLRSFGYLPNGGRSARMPGAVCLSSRKMELADGGDPIARQQATAPPRCTP
jgi:hypothetical protein